MVNFYHVFIPNAAEILKPLYGALSGKPRPKDLSWTSKMDQAFNQAKQLLVNATLLHHPVPEATTALTTDASDTAIGAVLEQQVDGHWQPLAFLVVSLTKPKEITALSIASY